jgi:hypothetical protein
VDGEARRRIEDWKNREGRHQAQILLRAYSLQSNFNTGETTAVLGQ